MKKVILLFLVLLGVGCQPEDKAAPQGYPEGAVVLVYDDIAGREKVTVKNNDWIVGEGDYQDGLRDGAWVEYDAASGFVTQVTSYLKGIRHGAALTFNSRTGQLSTKAYYNQDRLHGVHVTFNNRNRVEEKMYEQGVLNGISKKYYKSGGLLEEAPYVNGILHGTAKWYDEEGNLTIQYKYENGKFVEDISPGRE